MRHPLDDVPDAIAKGTNSPFGVAAGVWARDIRKAHQAAAELDAGTVWGNCHNAFDNASPRGGFKQSGWGAGEEALWTGAVYLRSWLFFTPDHPA